MSGERGADVGWMFFAAGGILRTRACRETLSPIDISEGFDIIKYVIWAFLVRNGNALGTFDRYNVAIQPTDHGKLFVFRWGNGRNRRVSERKLRRT